MSLCRILYTTCTAGMVLTVTQCSSFKISEKRTPIVKLTKPAQVSKGEINTAYLAAYQKIKLARKLEKQAPKEAINLYISAARIAYTSRDHQCLPLYNHAVGQVADLVVEHKQLNHLLAQTSLNVDEFSRKSIDDVIPVDCLKLRGWRTYVKQAGVGAPIVILRNKASLSVIDKKFATPQGLSYKATAVIEFPNNKKPVLRFYDPTKKATLDFWQKKQPLAYNLTSSVAVSQQDGKSSRTDTRLRWFGVFSPMNYVDKMGLYMTAPFDAQKIPIVLVHGLKSDPHAWRNVINELNADPVVRKKYQFLAFYYPTGLPLRVPSAQLKREINQLSKLYQSQGMQKNANQMVIIGHSLGGLLTSVQIRQIEKNLLQKMFKVPVDQLQINQRALTNFQYLIEGPKPSFVKRAIFVATPHQGSRNADIYLVRLLSSLVEIPRKMLFLQVPETAEALTDFGRSLFGAEKPENSLSLLQSQSSTLTILKNSPVYKHIKYHSIIGDRGRGDTPDSSDGIVAYQSSHLDGAESEKIVPSHHSAQNNVEAIQEMRRILLLNLRKK